MTVRPSRRKLFMGSTAAAALAILAAPVAAYAQARTHNFNVPSQDLGSALRALARQSGEQVIFEGAAVRGKRSTAVSGTYSTDAAAVALLRGTGLQVSRSQRGILVVRAGQAPGEAQAGSAAADDGSADAGAVSEILVVGSRSANVDIRRTEDDAQPVVVFNREQIERSQSTTLEDFFRTRLPSNSTQALANQSQTSAVGAQSTVNLRGLGTNQTLILVDGRRLASVGNGNISQQPDINGLPLSAIERIEVLPPTAAGIYGGDSVGGVINIITRRDYTGLQLTASYGNTTRWDAQEVRIEGSAGLSLEGGRTRIILSGSYQSTDPLLSGDRDFFVRSRNLVLENAAPTANQNFFNLSPPQLGYTTNIRSQNGSNLVLDNGTPLNSPLTFVPVGYAGPSTDGGVAFVQNAGRYNFDVADSSNIGGRFATYMTGREAATSTINIRREFAPWLEVFGDFYWSTNRVSGFTTPPLRSITIPAANNPFTTAITVTFPSVGIRVPYESRSDVLRGNAGLIVRLPHGWAANLDYVWSRTRTSFSLTVPVGDPDGAGPGLSVVSAIQNATVNVLRDINAFPVDWSPYLLPVGNTRSPGNDVFLNDISARISGPLLRLPGGPLTLTGAVEHRDERFADNLRIAPPSAASGTQSAAEAVTLFPEREQAVTSYYAEARAEIISPRNAIPFVDLLELQGSVRHDDYETRLPNVTFLTVPTVNGPFPDLTYNRVDEGATRFTLGMRYAPSRDITFRASYGTSFLPPTVLQLVPTLLTPAQVQLPADPKRGGTIATVNIPRVGGGNLELRPESAESWSIGAIVTPRFLPGLRLSVDYLTIRKRNEINTPTPLQLFQLEDQFPGRISRNPLTPADQALGYTGGTVTSYDASAVNVARTRVEAIDVQADYNWNSERFGDFHFYVIGTYTPHLRRQLLPNAPVLDYTGFEQLRWRANGGIDWSRDGLSISWNAQYYGNYNPCGAAFPACVTPILSGRDDFSQIYHDLYISYDFNDRVGQTSPLRGLRVSLGIQNLFDRNPPIIANISEVLQSAYSTYADPRLQRFTLTLRKQF